MQLSHKELYGNWLASLPLKRERRESKQADDDTMEEGQNSGGEEDDFSDDNARRIPRDQSQDHMDHMEPVSSVAPMNTELDRDVVESSERYLSTSHNRTASREPSELQHNTRQNDTRQRYPGREERHLSPTRSSEPRYLQLSPHVDTILERRFEMGHTAGSSGPVNSSERNADNRPHHLEHDHPQPNYDQHAYRSVPRHYYSQSLAEGASQSHGHPIRESLAQSLEAVNANRDQGEMFSRLDILLAAAEEPAVDQREHREAASGISTLDFASEHQAQLQSGRLPAARGDYSESGCRRVRSVLTTKDVLLDNHVFDPASSSTHLSMLNDMQTGAQSSNPTLPFPQNNPNSSLTPEAFIASTISLNSGNIPSVVSASPLDVYGMELDMGIYHDVFGWGLGAADVQQQAMGGYHDPELGAWSYDMLDLSALNNPTEFLGRGAISGHEIVGGPLTNSAAAHLNAGSTSYQSIKSGLREMHRPDGELLPSGRPSERTTRQGTATPGNGEEETPWVG